MATTRTVLRSKHTAKPVDLYMSFELGDKHWQISIGDGRRSVSRYTSAPAHTEAVADCIVKAGGAVATRAARPGAQLLRGRP